MTWPTRVWAVGEVLTAANMISFVSDPFDDVDALLDLATPTTFVDGAPLFGGGAASTFKQLAVLADGEIFIGDGVDIPTIVAAFTATTYLLTTERGGLEIDLTSVADGGILRGTGAGQWAILTAFLDASGRVTQEFGGLEFDLSTITTDDGLGGSGPGTIEIKVPMTQSEAELGTGTRFSLVSPERLKQTIDALGFGLSATTFARIRLFGH